VSAPHTPQLHHCAPRANTRASHLRFVIGSGGGIGQFIARATVRGVVGYADCMYGGF